MTSAAPPQNVFMLVDVDTAASPWLDVWEVVPRQETLAFATGASPSITAPVWQANFPADLRATRAALAAAQARLSAEVDTIAVAERRLRRFMITSSGPATAVSFDVARGPEAELGAMLNEVRRTELSYGVGEVLGDRWEDAVQQFQTWLARVTQLIANYADVQTRITGELKAWTIVTWTGAMTTTWPTPVDPEHIHLHAQTLALAMGSRVTLMRTLSAVVQGAALLAKSVALATTPGGQLLALPAAWRFFQLVRADVAAGKP